MWGCYLLLGPTGGLQVPHQQPLALPQRRLQLLKGAADLRHRLVLALHQLLADLRHQSDGRCQLWEPAEEPGTGWALVEGTPRRLLAPPGPLGPIPAPDSIQLLLQGRLVLLHHIAQRHGDVLPVLPLSALAAHGCLARLTVELHHLRGDTQGCPQWPPPSPWTPAGSQPP